jgi:hypothetical protein
VRSFLDRVVYVADRDLVLDFIVEDRLERTYDLWMKTLATFVWSRVVLKGGVGRVEELRTTTPPMSKRIAFGGIVEDVIMCVC